jgi:hypothetical protein
MMSKWPVTCACTPPLGMLLKDVLVSIKNGPSFLGKKIIFSTSFSFLTVNNPSDDVSIYYPKDDTPLNQLASLHNHRRDFILLHFPLYVNLPFLGI